MSRRSPTGIPDIANFTPKQRKRFATVISLVIFLVFVLLTANSFAQFYLDQLWFEHLGFGARFWREINFRAVIATLSGLAAAIPVWLTIDWLRRAVPQSDPRVEVIEPDEDPSDLGHRILAAQIGIVRGALSIGRWVVALIAGGLTAFSVDGQWSTVMLWWYRQPSGKTDAVFGHDLSYYFFTYPLEQLVVSDALTTVFLVVVVLGIVSFWAQLPQMIKKPGGSMAKIQHRLIRLWGLWVAIGLGFLSWRHLLGRIGLLYAEHQASFVGMDYIGDHWWRYSEYVLAVMALLAAVIALCVGAMPKMNAVRRIGIAAVVVYVASVVIALVIGGAYWGLRVRPNELESDRPYIGLSINATRQAYALDKFKDQEYNPTKEDRNALASKRAALGDVRLWDWQALRLALNQEQALRPYYQFFDIDVDRYKLDEQVHSVMISARELSTEKLPENSKTWTNQRFIYTHGYGVSMNLVNSFSPEGGPELLLKDMPVVSTIPTLKVTRPQIYFGELTKEHVYVHSTQQEFDYPLGQAQAGADNKTTVYEGKGGIPVYGYAARIAAAIALDDGFQLLLSSYMTPETQLLYRRQVEERVATLAPFLILDEDPYVMVTDEGRIQFVIDAYTHTDSYPGSPTYRWPVKHPSPAIVDLNYLRNSVKIVVDAYDGTVQMFVVDDQDPIIRAYRGFWPGLFKSASDMPADLRAHLRYPEGLMKLQAEMYATYHMTDPQTFYNKEDVWQVAQQLKNQNGKNEPVDASPYFVRAALTPDGATGFTLIMPFTPATRPNLIAWMAAECDPEKYGQVFVYRFPKNRLTPGPVQFEARIDQDAQLSPMLTLWNQQGSTVLRGDTIALPVAGQIIYIEPIYLQAQHSPMPELRIVVLGLENDLYWGTTFEEAFAKLAGAGPSPSTAPPGPQAPPSGEAAKPGTPQPAVPQDAAALAHSAAEHLRNYEKATAEGRHADAGRELDALKSDLEKLNKLKP